MRLVYPNAALHTIVIEGAIPSEEEHEGEHVIDLSEYATFDGREKVEYQQLKHTTVQGDTPFKLGNFKKTLTGFAKKFIQHLRLGDIQPADITFTIITNRPIEPDVKDNMLAMSESRCQDTRFKRAVERYGQGLSPDELQLFCGRLRFEDGLGDYNVQRDELRAELNQLMAGAIDTPQMDSVTTLMQDKVMPDSNGVIKKEDVLQRFGVTAERDLHPAPPIFNHIDNIINRQAYDVLISKIIAASAPVIVHADGGVGKSVFCQQFVKSLPEGSLGIAYDCFGAGGYRNRSSTRHRHRDALVQIANELASQGFCSPMIVHAGSQEKEIMRTFLVRMHTVVDSLRKTVPDAKLFIIIDAADNAEMAATEFGEPCFVHELLRETMPQGCTLVYSCRTERIALLQPPSLVERLELAPFSPQESRHNLQQHFPASSSIEGTEFHRLTAGNPRAQANTLHGKYATVEDLLKSLGPSGISVDQQIEHQLRLAIGRLKDSLPGLYHGNIDAVCQGLASLPPYIPIEVLAKVSDIEVSTLRSFVADIGSSLWISDTSIQFRDEPTETWFRKTFIASRQAYEKYMELLEPIATDFVYVAAVLPQLYLQTEQYAKLIDIALSDRYLPVDNPIDARNVRVYRLQFAFKAALRLSQYKDAVQLAMRAGEEVAGDQRQFQLLQNNIDLLVSLQDKEKVQEIAFKRSLKGQWDGSENIYAAALLSGIKDSHGEAAGFLRAAKRWLEICFEQAGKEDDTDGRRYKVAEQDILEMAYASLNIHGVDACLEFLSGFQPNEAVFRIVQDLANRLVDMGRFDEITTLLYQCQSEPYFTVAITSALAEVGRYPEASLLTGCLDLLFHRDTRIAKPEDLLHDRVMPAIILFLEACLASRLSKVKILWVLRAYVPMRAMTMSVSSNYSQDRALFFKAVAIRSLLQENVSISPDHLMPQQWVLSKEDYERESRQQFVEISGGLLPWYLLRAKLIYNSRLPLLELIGEVSTASKEATRLRYRAYDRLPVEITEVCASILINYQQGSADEIAFFYQQYLHKASTFDIRIRLQILRAANRTTHLVSIAQDLELSTFELVKRATGRGQDEISDDYVALSRAVINTSIDDARLYFNEAIIIVSKFGDELVQRWEAVASLAKEAAGGVIPEELAYRFIRCAELVGNSVTREKHWSRNEAISICAKMSPAVALASLSRWRDRAVGRFEYNFQALIIELLKSGYITPVISWSLTRLLPGYDVKHILESCLIHEPSPVIQQQIFDDAIVLLSQQGVQDDAWVKMSTLGQRHSLGIPDIVHDKVAVTVRHDSDNAPDKITPTDNASPKIIDWNEVFAGIDLFNLNDFLMLLDKSNNLMHDTGHKILFAEVIGRIKEGQLWDFINVLLDCDHINHFEMSTFLSLIPTNWQNRVSFKQKWEKVIHDCGMRYAHDLTNEYNFNTFIKQTGIKEPQSKPLKVGVMAGLAGGSEVNDATVFFGLAQQVASLLNAQQATQVLDYAIGRFELHCEPDFGDGPWSEWLCPSNTAAKNIAQFIWSVLGAPKTSQRWSAAHCVRKLSDFGCNAEIDALIQCLHSDHVGAFGGKQLVFYHLHARLYLLIALSRISQSRVTLLNSYAVSFADLALKQDHILIQRAARDIALTVEQSFPNTFDAQMLEALNNVGRPIGQRVESHRYTTDSYLHQEGRVDDNIEFDFAWDFDRYWFAPQGKVFGISEQQVEQIAANVVINEWAQGNKDAFKQDARRTQWASSSAEDGVWSSHGNYPKTDNLQFYLSYHALMVVAGRLLQTMPVIIEETGEDPLEDWLSEHWLTRKDGKWLADHRAPLPPRLVNNEAAQNDFTHWQEEITTEDFLACLKTQLLDKEGLIIKGSWQENTRSRMQSVSISSALVSTAAASALLRTLSTYESTYDYGLPAYEDAWLEFDIAPFALKGWVQDHHISKGIDQQDPYAGRVDYPFFQLGDSIIGKCGLEMGNVENHWLDGATGQLALQCDTWGSYQDATDKEPGQYGMRLIATLPFLQHVCDIFDCDIIFDVRIRRDIPAEYRSRDAEYRHPVSRIFLLSKHGKLTTTTADYQLG